MKSLWSVVSFLAVVHLLALLGFLGWMYGSDRLSLERVRTVRELFAMTMTDEKMQKEEQERETTVNPERDSSMFQMSSTRQIELMTDVQRQELLATQRMKDESEMHARQFSLLNQKIASEREEFEKERRRWEEATGADRERKTNEQFTQTVIQYESLPAKQGKQVLIELINSGNREQAVAYLDAMKPRATSKILKEFKSPEEIILAAELLEELRIFGLGTVDSQESSNADVLANADNPAP
ncbi:MAG: hypothetical protein IID30_04690 [Planctomycetes bacterium]|nr:hypothetical protein [Planctomycetota bacterium]MCH7601388.1 hypothetical protein [Planctomycetota bacterium]